MRKTADQETGIEGQQTKYLPNSLELWVYWAFDVGDLQLWSEDALHHRPFHHLNQKTTNLTVCLLATWTRGTWMGIR